MVLPELDARELQALGELVAPSTGTGILKELRVGSLGTRLFEAGAVQELVSRVSVSSSLQNLQLGNADMQSSMSTLAALLEKNSNLNFRKLTLYGCQIGGTSGAKSLAGALCKNL